MKVVVQRVLEAHCDVAGKPTVSIGPGLLLYVSFRREDTVMQCAKMAQKIAKLRIFSDAQDKLNLSAHDLGKEVLVISQFTLEGNTQKGHRPSFTEAMNPVEAERLFSVFVEDLRALLPTVKKGFFQEHMNITSNNDGPVTLLLESTVMP